jgi:zinc/manganese transport system permease protein
MIWQNDFFLVGLLVSFLLTLVSAPLGAFLTLKRMSLMGDAISHSLLPGMAISIMIFGFSTMGLLLGGLAAGILVLGLMFWITQKSTFKDDSVLALIYLTMSSLGILLISKSEVKVDLMHFLFGNILLVPQEWIYLIAISVIIVLIVFFKIKDRLIYVIVDPEFSRFLKIPEAKIKSIFYFLVLWVLILSFYSVGTMLALGYLIIPTLIAKLFTKNLRKQIILSVVVGWFISIVGELMSFQMDLPTGPAIIFVGCNTTNRQFQTGSQTEATDSRCSQADTRFRPPWANTPTAPGPCRPK